MYSRRERRSALARPGAVFRIVFSEAIDSIAVIAEGPKTAGDTNLC
jgi:hypothetical protein